MTIFVGNLPSVCRLDDFPIDTVQGIKIYFKLYLGIYVIFLHLPFTLNVKTRTV